MIRTILKALLATALALLASAGFFLNCYQPPVPPFDAALSKMFNDDVASFRAYLSMDREMVAVTSPWDKSTLLHAACMSLQNTEVIKVLLDAGADPNALDDLGRTPMHNLCLGHPNAGDMAVQIAWQLLIHGGDFSIKDVKGKTPFDYSDGTSWGALANVVDTKFGEVASHWEEYFLVIVNDDVEELSKIVPERIPVDWIEPGNGMTMLCTAMTRQGKQFPLKCVHYLIERGANVNLGFPFWGDYFPPIRLCHNAETNAIQVAEWLFDAGASFVDDKLTDRICLRGALRNRDLFDYYLSKDARAELLLPLHPLRREQETYFSPILEEAFSATDVSIEMFEHVYQLVSKQVEILNPTLGLYGYSLSETDEERKNQRDKMQFLIAHGFDTNACFECRIYGSARKAPFSEHLKRWDAQGILEKQILGKGIKESDKAK